MSFNINKKLIFIDSFQFLISSLDTLAKKLSKDDFKYLSQELHCKVLHLVNQKRFYPYEYMSGFKIFKEELLSKENCYNLFSGRKISDNNYQHVFKVLDRPELKKMNDYYDFF